MMSPFLAAADDGLVLLTWFQWLPVQVDLLFLPDSELMMLALAMVVLAGQYLLIFFLVMPLRPLARGILKFMIAPLRRGLFAH